MIVTIPFQSTHLKNIRVVSNDRTVIYDLGYDDITPQRFNELLDNIEAASPQDSLQYIHTYRANDKIVIGRKSMICTTPARRWGISCCTLTNPS